MAIVERRGNQMIIVADAPASAWERFKYSVRGVLAHLAEMWHYRELLRNLVIRDLKVRYRNSALGILWSFGNPLLMMLVFTLVFTVMAPTGRGDGIEKFPVFVLCGLLPWNFFSSSVVGSIRSIVDNAPLVRKIYFPREALPVSLVLANLVNFLIALIVLFVFILIFQVPLTIWALLLPVVLAVEVVFIIGMALLLATINVFYRDTQVIMEVLMLAWFFMTPVFYPITILPQAYPLWGDVVIDVQRWMFILNPMASLVATYRVILYSGAPPAFDFFLRTALTALGVLLVGAAVFFRYGRVFGEEV